MTMQVPSSGPISNKTSIDRDGSSSLDSGADKNSAISITSTNNGDTDSSDDGNCTRNYYNHHFVNEQRQRQQQRERRRQREKLDRRRLCSTRNVVLIVNCIIIIFKFIILVGCIVSLCIDGPYLKQQYTDSYYLNNYYNISMFSKILIDIVVSSLQIGGATIGIIGAIDYNCDYVIIAAITYGLSTFYYFIAIINNNNISVFIFNTILNAFCTSVHMNFIRFYERDDIISYYDYHEHTIV